MIPRTAREPNGAPDGPDLTGRQIRGPCGTGSGTGRLRAWRTARLPSIRAARRAAGGELAKRVADADRDRTVTMLREHVVEGRLTLDEFSERVGAALGATTRGELEAVMADLPGGVRRPRPPAVTAPQDAGAGTSPS